VAYAIFGVSEMDDTIEMRSADILLKAEDYDFFQVKKIHYVKEHVDDAQLPTISKGLAQLLLPKRGLTKEEQGAFWELSNQILQKFGPVDLLDQFIISRTINLMWDLMSLTRYQDSLLAQQREESLYKILIGRVENCRELIKAVRRGEQEAISKVERLFEQFSLNETDIQAQSFLTHLRTIETLRRLEALALKEIPKLLRELDRRKMVREASYIRSLKERALKRRIEGKEVRMEVPD